MDFESCISYIVQSDNELEAIRILTSMLNRKYNKLVKQYAHANACLAAIKKINNGKSEAIDALCDNEEGYDG